MKVILPQVVSHDVKQGDHNQSVRLVQRTIRECSDNKLVVDGKFGPGTTAALKVYQTKLGLDPTGLYLGETKRVTDKYIGDRFVQEWCYAAAANSVGRDAKQFTALAKSIASVEARTEGFNADSSVSILFERHKFYQSLLARLKSNPEDKAHVSVNAAIRIDTPLNMVTALAGKYPNICNKSSGGYKGGIAEHARLKQACDIHPIVGAASASYGLYQIMGFNAQQAGFKDPDDMYNHMLHSEIVHIQALANFLESNPSIYVHLRNGNRAGIAKLYNGPGYAANNYDTKLDKELVKYGF